MSLLLVIMTLSASVANTVNTVNTVKVRRQGDPDMGQIVSDLTDLGLTYGGDIKHSESDGIWLPTTQGVMQQYTTPQNTTPITLEQAVGVCRDLGGRLWDRDPQQATGFARIKMNQPYWILGDDGSIAEYTVKNEIPEVVYDKMCTQVTVVKPEEEAEKKIEVASYYDLNPERQQGCQQENYIGLTLCLRPVKDVPYANSPNYRQDQEETKTLIREQEETAGTRLQEIQEELITNSYQTSEANNKIITKLQIIKTAVDKIKAEDQKSFPNFRRIKAIWRGLRTQLQELEGISTKLLQRKQIDKANIQIETNRRHQAETKLDWTEKWKDMQTQISKRQLKETTTEEPGAANREPEQTGPENKEGDTLNNKVVEYFKNILQEMKRKRQTYEDFCSHWQLDCGAIAVTSLIMIGIGLITMTATIKFCFSMYELTRRVNRLFEYMDLQETKKAQEEDDDDWQTRITNVNDNYIEFQPNPTRNRAQMRKNYTNLNNRLNQTAQALIRQGFIMDININQPGGQRELGRDQEQAVTFPFLGP